MSDQTAPQPQGQQIPTEDVFEIYGKDCMMLKINIKHLAKANRQLQEENAQLKQQLATTPKK